MKPNNVRTRLQQGASSGNLRWRLQPGGDGGRESRRSHNRRNLSASFGSRVLVSDADNGHCTGWSYQGAALAVTASNRGFGVQIPQNINHSSRRELWIFICVCCNAIISPEGSFGSHNDRLRLAQEPVRVRNVIHLAGQQLGVSW